MEYRSVIGVNSESRVREGGKVIFKFTLSIFGRRITPYKITSIIT